MQNRGSTMAHPTLVLKRYALPAILVALAILWQLAILPRNFPRSHYDAIGVKPNSSTEEIIEAYERLSRQWFSDIDRQVVTENVIEILHAFELLSDSLRRRDYDLFGVDELQDVARNAKKHYVGAKLSKVDLPLLKISELDHIDYNTNVLSSENFGSMLGDNITWLIQVYSVGSVRSHLFAHSWKRIGTWLDGVANTGTVELGEVRLAAFLAERNKATGHPFFRYGLPAIIVFPANCRRLDCIVRYSGELSVDAIVDWVATNIIGLPRILYYSADSLVTQVIQKSGHHKVKVICFSKTGERATPFLRQAAREYWAYASFGFVLWQEENASLWWNMFGVESAPAIVFLKDPGLEPVVHYGAISSYDFQNLMEQHKNFALPQLRSMTSAELGCDAGGYSRAGNETLTWYCAIVAGRPGFQLSKMREAMRRVQDSLTDEVVADSVDRPFPPASLVAASAFKTKRLTLAWLDGEVQKKYCFFYLHSEDVFQTCGPRRYGEFEDVPRIFLVRYKRNATEAKVKVEKRLKTIWDMFQEDDEDLASQLVARYNGSMEVSEIMAWISQIIEDGDTKELPNFKTKTPDLVPEESKPAWSHSPQIFVFRRARMLQERIRDFIIGISDYMKDPRIGPILLLIASLYLGSICLKTNQPTQQSGQVDSVRNNTNEPVSSMTDVEPPDAYQAIETDSDSSASAD